jgi:hypothetical protein
MNSGLRMPRHHAVIVSGGVVRPLGPGRLTPSQAPGPASSATPLAPRLSWDAPTSFPPTKPPAMTRSPPRKGTCTGPGGWRTVRPTSCPLRSPEGPSCVPPPCVIRPRPVYTRERPRNPFRRGNVPIPPLKMLLASWKVLGASPFGRRRRAASPYRLHASGVRLTFVVA